MKKPLFFLLFFLLNFVFTNLISAGGGRIELIVLDKYGDTGGKKVRVEAKLSKDDASPSVGEKAEFKLLNPRAGDFCTTFNNVADSNGYIRGECGSNQAGGLTMYVHSLDQNQDSYTVFFQIVEAPLPTVTLAPTKIPVTPTKTIIKTPALSPTIESTTAATPTIDQTVDPTVSPTPSDTANIEASVKSTINWPMVLIGFLAAVAMIAGGIFILTKKTKGIAQKTASEASSMPTIEVEPNTLATEENIRPRSTPTPLNKKGLFLLIAGILFLFGNFLYLYWQNRQNSASDKQQENALQTDSLPANAAEENAEVNPSIKTTIAPVETTPTPAPPTATPTPTVTPTPAGVTIKVNGFIYEDKNCNYRYDEGDAPLPSVEVSLYQFEGQNINALFKATTGADGKYAFSKFIGLNDQLIVQPGPYRNGYAVIAMSGLPQKITLNRANRSAVQDIPMVRNEDISKCR